MKRTRSRLSLTILFVALLTSFPFGSPLLAEKDKDQPRKAVKLRSLAMLVHHLDEMVAFYSEAFHTEFKPREIQGVQCWFGEVGGLTMKLVPLRQGTDFKGFPLQQPGFEVDDVETVIQVALRHGGRQEGEIQRENGQVHGAVRDPDGNTIELYAEE